MTSEEVNGVGFVFEKILLRNNIVTLYPQNGCWRQLESEKHAQIFTQIQAHEIGRLHSGPPIFQKKMFIYHTTQTMRVAHTHLNINTSFIYIYNTYIDTWMP